MVRIIVKKLIWDVVNRKHIKKHNVSVEEVEQVREKVVGVKIAKRGCYFIIGRSGARIISALIIRREVGVYYLITARDASKKERRIVYEKEKT